MNNSWNTALGQDTLLLRQTFLYASSMHFKNSSFFLSRRCTCRCLVLAFFMLWLRYEWRRVCFRLHRPLTSVHSARTWTVEERLFGNCNQRFQTFSSWRIFLLRRNASIPKKDAQSGGNKKEKESRRAKKKRRTKQT